MRALSSVGVGREAGKWVGLLVFIWGVGNTWNGVLPIVAVYCERLTTKEASIYCIVSQSMCSP